MHFSLSNIPQSLHHCRSHLLPAWEGSQCDIGLHVSLLVQGDHLGARPVLPPRRGQVMDQFQGCGLVDGVGVSPVDANLEGFLRDSSERGRRVRK